MSFNKKDSMGKLHILKEELEAGHPLTGPYSHNSQIAERQINELNLEHRAPVDSSEVLAWSAGSSPGDRPRIVKIIEAAEKHKTESVRAVAIVTEIMLRRDGTDLDLSLPDRESMLNSLVAGGVLSVADRQDLVSKVTTMMSRADQLGIGAVRAGTIEQARELKNA